MSEHTCKKCGGRVATCSFYPQLLDPDEEPFTSGVREPCTSKDGTEYSEFHVFLHGYAGICVDCHELAWGGISELTHQAPQPNMKAMSKPKEYIVAYSNLNGDPRKKTYDSLWKAVRWAETNTSVWMAYWEYDQVFTVGVKTGPDPDDWYELLSITR